MIPVNYHARREHSPGKARDSSSGCIYARDELNIEGEGRETRCKAGGLEHLFLHDGARDINTCMFMNIGRRTPSYRRLGRQKGGEKRREGRQKWQRRPVTIKT